MDGIVPDVSSSVKRRLGRHLRQCSDAKLCRRYLIIINLINSRSPPEVAVIVGIAPSTLYRVAERFREQGEWGLLDRRADNGQQKLNERYLATLYDVAESHPQAHGWRRPTWTREMLVETMRQKTGVRIDVGTMSRALKRIGARRGYPRPVVGCPWSKRAKNKRMRMIGQLLSHLPPHEVAVYADEVDIHLNPKIGLDWMVRGQQKEVMTPGQNIKRYVAGAMDAVTGQLTWVEGEHKNSLLFITLLHRLRKTYSHAKKIHVILDNYRIHSSAITQAVIASLGDRIVLHFLPPYCPQHNKIERLWEDLHAEVTRNHRCRSMASLMGEVRRFLRQRGRKAHSAKFKRIA